MRVGAAVKGGFHHVGFHATGIVAHFSSAVIAGRLLGLTAEQIVGAQGIAASTASGVQVFLEEGAWTKRFHPGWAAVAGITAARLSQAGFLGPSRPYEGRFGLFETHLQAKADHVDLDIMVDELRTRWHSPIRPSSPIPSATSSMAAPMRRSNSAPPSTGATSHASKPSCPGIRCRSSAEPAAAKERPTTDYEAKFSAQFVVATCLIKGRFNLPELREDALRDADVRDLATRVTCAIDGTSAFPQYFSGGVKLVLKDGRELFRHVRVNSGAGERALDTDGVTAKFMASASLAVDAAQAGTIRDIVLDIENRTVAELAAALAQAGLTVRSLTSRHRPTRRGQNPHGAAGTPGRDALDHIAIEGAVGAFGDEAKMRRQHDVGRIAQRMVARQRLDIEDVETGADAALL